VPACIQKASETMMRFSGIGSRDNDAVQRDWLVDNDAVQRDWLVAMMRFSGIG
jgi:hypothetical protein